MTRESFPNESQFREGKGRASCISKHGNPESKNYSTERWSRISLEKNMMFKVLWLNNFMGDSLNMVCITIYISAKAPRS